MSEKVIMIVTESNEMGFKGERFDDDLDEEVRKEMDGEDLGKVIMVRMRMISTNEKRKI